jgi:hypothetical protein
MNRRHTSKLILFLLVVLSGSRLWTQGPAYQTDDPEPVDLHHYEFYLFGSTGGTPVETDIELGAKIAMIKESRYVPQIGTLTKRFELESLVFAHGREGFATPQTKASTLIDVGGVYHLKHHEGKQFLYCDSHSVAGQTENYTYVGMYWTWGKDKKKPDADAAWLQGPMNAKGFQGPVAQGRLCG